MKTKISARVAACVLLVILLAAFCSGAGAAEIAENLSVSLSYTDASGQEQISMASWMGYPGYEDAFWVQLPAGTDLNALRLNISDPSGIWQTFFPADGDVLGGVADCGQAAENAVPVVIYAYGGAGDVYGTQLRLYVSTEAPMPVPAQQVTWPRQVTVHYRDENGGIVAGDTVQDIYEGMNTVYACPDMLPDGYMLSGGDAFVWADSDGSVDPDEVTFIYVYQAPVTWPRTVTVHYMDENGMPVAGDTLFEVYEGENMIYAQPVGLPEGYTLSGEDAMVWADSDGTVIPEEVTFVYTYKAPVFWPQTVTVHYVDENGAPVAGDTLFEVYEGENTVFAQPADLPEGYFSADGTRSVWADSEGNVIPGEVSFVYQYREPVEWPVYVTVHYLDEMGEPVAEDTLAEICQGENLVYPQPIDLKEGYAGDEVPVTVRADETGYTEPAEITFIYHSQAPAILTAEVVLHYIDESGSPVAEDTRAEVCEGENLVYAQPLSLPEGYENIGAEVCQVILGQDGVCYPDSVTFVYAKIFTVDWPVMLPVHYYRLEEDIPVASDSLCPIYEGENLILPDPADLEDGYRLHEGEGGVIVTADQNGNPDIAAVIFRYDFDPGEDTAETVGYAYLRYVDEDTGEQIAEDSMIGIRPGQNLIEAPDNIREGYHPVETATVVYADENGSIGEEGVITLAYYYEADSEEEAWSDVIIVPQNVTVYYLALDGSNVAPSATVLCTAGENRILCEPTELKENYEPVDPTPYTVYVDENGASALEVTFWFDYIARPVPAEEIPVTATPEPVPETTPEPETAVVTPEPSPVYVRVRYINLDSGEEFAGERLLCAAGAVTPIYANTGLIAEKLGDGYEVRGESRIDVSVTAEGAVTPENAVFYVSAQKAYVTVCYRDENGNEIASPSLIECPEGYTPVRAEPLDLKPGYEPDPARGQQIVNVYQEDGIVTPNTVDFFYKRIPDETAVPEPEYIIDAMDTYARPKADSFVRSAPTSEEDNRVFTVGPADVLHVTGRTVNERGENWYRIGIDGMTGFMKDNSVSMMNDDQIRDYLNGTPTPAPVTPTPAPTATPDFGNTINLWGRMTKSSVNYREGPGTNYKSKGKLDKSTKVWVLEVQPDQDGNRWYRIMYKSKTYYVSADYVELYSLSESEKIQAGLPSPAPEIAPPTSEPTMMPTFTPVPTEYIPVTEVPVTPPPTPEPVFEPYIGYAVTILDTYLWNETDRNNGYTVYLADFDTLLLVRDQVFDADGTLWDDVTVVGKEAEGFIPDGEIRYVDDQEAYAYLTVIPAAPTATPMIVTPEPEPYSGYYRVMGLVPLRAAPDGQAMITTMLTENTVCYVIGQEYTDGEAWDLVQCADMYGFVRGDQLYGMSASEVQAYLDSLRTATPQLVPVTPAPVSEEDDSCFGYVNTNSGKVNLRSAPDENSLRLGLYSQYTLCTVIGNTYDGSGKMWYRVLIDDREGYIRSDYLTVLKQNEVTPFRNSQEYRSAISAAGEQQAVQEKMPSIEDRNLATWNPGTVVVYATVTPEPTAQPTFTPMPTQYAYVDPTMSPVPLAALPIGQNPTAEPEPEIRKESGSGTIVLIVVLTLVAGGAGIYAYTIHLRNERRRAQVREQQARRSVRNEQNGYQVRKNSAGQSAQQGAFSREAQQDAPYYFRSGTADSAGNNSLYSRPVSADPGRAAQENANAARSPEAGQTAARTAAGNYARPETGNRQPVNNASAAYSPVRTAPAPGAAGAPSWMNNGYTAASSSQTDTRYAGARTSAQPAVTAEPAAPVTVPRSGTAVYPHAGSGTVKISDPPESTKPEDTAVNGYTEPVRRRRTERNQNRNV